MSIYSFLTQFRSWKLRKNSIDAVSLHTIVQIIMKMLDWIGAGENHSRLLFNFNDQSVDVIALVAF